MVVRLTKTESKRRTAADVIRDLGDIPPDRILVDPPIGTATARNLLGRKGVELIDGTLVEKATGLHESILAVYIGRLIDEFVEANDLGLIAGEQGGTQLAKKLVRIADVSFYSWEQLPNDELPDEAFPKLAPCLAVEVLSKRNTKGEMRRKRKDYFKAGVKFVWIVDRFNRTVTVYTSETDFQTLREGDIVDGGDVLPGLQIPVRKIFGRIRRKPRR